MIKLVPKACMLKLCLCIALSANAQALDSLERFREFQTLSSTISDVEKVYGKGMSKSNPYFVTYVTSELRISVEYASGDCNSKAPFWNVPEWTITEITYSFLNAKPKLRNLIAGSKRFLVRRSGDVLNHDEYYNDAEGISVLYDKKNEGVMDVIIRPSSEKIRKYECR